MNKTRILITSICFVVLAGLVVGTAGASNDWRGTKAQVSDGSSKFILRLWERGTDVVLTFEVSGAITNETRCENGVLTDLDVVHNSTVVHADMSPGDCARIAASPLRGAGRDVSNGKFKASASVGGQGRTTYVSDDPNLPVIVLEDTTKLPVSVSYGGHTMTFEYDQIDAAAPPPTPVGHSPTYVEEYRTATASDIATAFKVKSLPAQVGNFGLAKSFTFDSGPTTGRAYYAIWLDKSGREVQMVLNTKVPNRGSEYGFTDDGGQVSFRVFEDDTELQTFAPDLPSLRAAVVAVRPGLAAQLEQEISHPTAPEVKNAPTK
jgi:hypothetical protein